MSHDVDDIAGEGKDDFVRWSRVDMRLARRAARERWGVPDPIRSEVLFTAARILADPEASHRDRLAASKLLIDADKHDLAEDKFRLELTRFEHETKAAEAPADDFTIDLSDEPYQGDPPLQGDGPAT